MSIVSGASQGSSMGPWGAVAGAGMGLLQARSDKQHENQDRMLAAQTQMYSPWTKMSAQAPQHSNATGDILSGVTTGIAQQQGMEKAAGEKAFNDAKIQALQSQTGQGGPPSPSPSPWASMPRKPVVMAPQQSSLANAAFQARDIS